MKLIKDTYTYNKQRILNQHKLKNEKIRKVVVQEHIIKNNEGNNYGLVNRKTT